MGWLESRQEFDKDGGSCDGSQGSVTLSLELVLESIRAAAEDLTQQQRQDLAAALHEASAKFVRGPVAPAHSAKQRGYSVFRALLFIFYVSIGAGTFLVVRLTENERGEIAYNTSVAVLATECCKLVVAKVLAWHTGERVGTISWSQFCKYGAPALIYAIQNNLNIHGISYLSAPVFTLFNNSKILFSALFATLLLRQKFSRTQWASLCLLIVSLCVAKLPLLVKAIDILTTGAQVDASLYRFLLGLLLVLIASFTSGLAGSCNEFLLKNTDDKVGFFTKSTWTYQWGVALNLIAVLRPVLLEHSLSGASTSTLLQAIQQRLTQGFDSAGVWVLVAVNASNGLTVGLILKHFDNIVKCFGNVLMVYVVTLVSYLFVPDTQKHIDGGLLTGISLYALSSYLYTAFPYAPPRHLIYPKDARA